MNRPFPKRRPPWEVFWLLKNSSRRTANSASKKSAESKSSSSLGSLATVNLDFSSSEDEYADDGDYEEFLVENARNETEFEEATVCIRLHHCLGDGISLCYCLLAKFYDVEETAETRVNGSSHGTRNHAWAPNRPAGDVEEAEAGSSGARVFRSNLCWRRDGKNKGKKLVLAEVAENVKSTLVPVSMYRMGVEAYRWILAFFTAPIAILRY
jgi:hypothetical protein